MAKKPFEQHSEEQIEATKQAHFDAAGDTKDAALMADRVTSGTEVESEPFANAHNAIVGNDDEAPPGTPETDAGLAAKGAESGTDSDSDDDVALKNMFYHSGIEALTERVVTESKPGTTGLVLVSRYFVRDIVRALTRSHQASYQATTRTATLPEGGDVLVVDRATVDDASLNDVRASWIVTDDASLQDNTRVQSFLKGGKKAKKG